MEDSAEKIEGVRFSLISSDGEVFYKKGFVSISDVLDEPIVKMDVLNTDIDDIVEVMIYHLAYLGVEGDDRDATDEEMEIVAEDLDDMFKENCIDVIDISTFELKGKSEVEAKEDDIIDSIET